MKARLHATLALAGFALLWILTVPQLGTVWIQPPLGTSEPQELAQYELPGAGPVPNPLPRREARGELEGEALLAAYRRLAQIDFSDAKAVEKACGSEGEFLGNLARTCERLRRGDLGEPGVRFSLPEIGALRTLYLELETANGDALPPDFGSLPQPTRKMLSRLLHSTGNRDLAWAADLHDREDSGPELRAAIMTTVAASAPVDAAAEFLAQRVRSTLTEVQVLGQRSGGIRALQDAYYARRILGTQAEARRALVAGMRAAEPAQLLAIAREDPDAEVRGQALVVLTSQRTFRPTHDVLVLLQEGWSNQEDPNARIPIDAVVHALRQFAGAPGADPEGRKAADDLLSQVAALSSLGPAGD